MGIENRGLILQNFLNIANGRAENMSEFRAFVLTAIIIFAPGCSNKLLRDGYGPSNQGTS